MPKNETFDGTGGSITYYPPGMKTAKSGEKYEADASLGINYHRKPVYLSLEQCKFVFKTIQENERLQEVLENGPK